MNILMALIWVVCSSNGLPINQNTADLLMETCAAESDFGKYEKQFGGGPARGIFQMEPSTAWDIVDHYVEYRPELQKIVYPWLDRGRMEDLLLKPEFAIIMTRIHYMRTGIETPDTRLGRASHWKRTYNTYLGKGTIEHYMNKSFKHLGE